MYITDDTKLKIRLQPFLFVLRVIVVFFCSNFMIFVLKFLIFNKFIFSIKLKTWLALFDFHNSLEFINFWKLSCKAFQVWHFIEGTIPINPTKKCQQGDCIYMIHMHFGFMSQWPYCCQFHCSKPSARMGGGGGARPQKVQKVNLLD